jgi:hypothetical protein
MRNSILHIFLLLVLINISAVAQEMPDAIAHPDDSLIRKYQKVMIIPFENNMYVCGIQPYLAASSGKTHIEIVEYFREAVAIELQNQFLYLYNTASLIHYSDTNKDIFKAYDAVSYKFEIAPEEDEEETDKDNSLDKAKNKAKNLFKRKKATKYQRGLVKDGNIVSNKNTEQKFASAVVRKKENIQYLSKKYRADLFVYITEMDVENDISDQNAFINNEYERFLRLHYTMINKKGEVIGKGVVYTKFPNSVNTIEEINKTYLPLVAKKLRAKLPQPVKPKVDPKKAVNVTEKIRN